jgi:hypothetical protein
VIDPDRWERFLLHVLDECTTEDADLIRAERNAVHIFTAVFRALDQGDT